MLNIEGLTLENLGEDSLQALRVENEFCSALIALQGAQILAFHQKQEQSEKALLWCSELNSYQQGKAIRGGIPLCFPWFGANSIHAEYPSHGFARNLIWQWVSAEADESGHQLVFELRDTADTRKYWDFAFCLQMKIHCGAELQLELNLVNLDQQDFEFGFAWHSYFPTQITTTKILGLAGETYIDQLEQNRIKQQQDESIQFAAETDRIYPVTQGKFVLQQNNHDKIVIQSNAKSTVIWNPWVEKAARLNDVRDDAWQDFVCIECGQVANQTRQLKSGEQIKYQMKIGTLSLF